MLSYGMNQTACVPLDIEPRWKRDIKQDVKEGIDLLFKFKEELSKLHPEAVSVIELLVQKPRY